MWMPIGGYGSAVLMCTVAGDFADRVEKLDQEDLKAEILDHLRECTGRDIPVIHDIHVARWRTEENFKGAYSFLPTHSFNENPVMFHWLTEPVCTVAEGRRFRPTLHFAGEAFDFNYGGQLQGAFTSGRDTAIRIIREINEENMSKGQQPFVEFQMPPQGYVMQQNVVTT